MDGLLTIDYPVDFTTYVKKRIVTIRGHTVDSVERIEIQTNNDTVATVDRNSDGAFFYHAVLVEGENTILITVSDGKGQSETIEKKIVSDTKLPVIQGILITPNPVNIGEKVRIYVTVVDEKQQAILRRVPFRLGNYKNLNI